jgi:transcriptional regulator with PAS, ATPase and Fis domain
MPPASPGRRAAEALNISTVTLWRRIKHYGVRVPPYRRD